MSKNNEDTEIINPKDIKISEPSENTWWSHYNPDSNESMAEMLNGYSKLFETVSKDEKKLKTIDVEARIVGELESASPEQDGTQKKR